MTSTIGEKFNDMEVEYSSISQPQQHKCSRVKWALGVLCGIVLLLVPTPLTLLNETFSLGGGTGAISIGEPKVLNSKNVDDSIKILDTYKDKKLTKDQLRKGQWMVGVDTEQSFKRGIRQWVNHDGINSLDVSNGYYKDHKWIWDPVAEKKLNLHWYNSAEDGCKLLNNFRIFFTGQSTERRLMFALSSMAYGINDVFDNGFAPHTVQHIKDTAGISALKRQNLPNPCTRNHAMTFTDYRHRMIHSLDSVAKKWATRTDEEKANGARPVLVVNWGLYSISSFRVDLAQGRKSKTVSQANYLLQGLKQLVDMGVLVIWKLVSPVDESAARWSNYKGRVNEIIGAYNAHTAAIAQQYGLCVLDLYRPTMRGKLSNEYLYEHGAIHIKDHGRQLSVQLFLNVLKTCSENQPLPTKDFSFDIDDKLRTENPNPLWIQD